MPVRARRGAVSLLLVAVAATACSAAVAGTGRTAAPSGPTSSSDSPSPSPSPSPTLNADSQLPGSRALLAELSSAPSGSHPFSSDWAAQIMPTVRQFVAALYDTSNAGTVTNHLLSEGVDGLAHRTWVTPAFLQADDILLHFNNPVGASDRYELDVNATSRDGESKPFTVTGFPSDAEASGFYDPKVDSKGNVFAKVEAVSGSTVMFFNFYSPDAPDTATASAWAAVQFGRL